MYYLGIDVGKNGGVVLLNENKNIIASSKMNEMFLFNILRNYNNIFAFVERVHSMPKQGVKSTFTFGYNLGFIIGVLQSHGVEYELIEPLAWKKYFSLIKKDKKESCKKALELDNTLKCYGKRNGLLDGICDAYLICVYGIENKKNNKKVYHGGS